MEKKEQGIVIYERKDGVHFEVTLRDDTIWLSQTQIGNLFVVKKAAVSKHVKNIFEDGELSRRSTVSKMETVQREGARLIKRKIELYNLDMIIAVGYRVNSRHATRFRIWATKVLHDHLIQGFTTNQKRLLERQEIREDSSDLTLIDPGNVTWTKRSSGVFTAHLAHDPLRDLFWTLFKIEPGAHLSRHRHPSWEWVTVLEGVYEDESFSVPAGKMKINSAGSVHASRSTLGCTLLVVWCGRHESVK